MTTVRNRFESKFIPDSHGGVWAGGAALVRGPAVMGTIDNIERLTPPPAAREPVAPTQENLW